MKILLIHSDFIEYEPVKKALKNAEDVKKEKKRVDECLVVFAAAEKGDNDNTIKNTAKEIEAVAGDVSAKKIVIYPFVHLTQKPALPSDALKLLKKLESMVQLDVSRAPFGWYKSFNIKCKGHPLSELSREITAEEKEGVKAVTAKTHISKEELSENDHRIIGQKLDLYSFQEPAPGMAFFHPKGMIIWNELLDFWRKEHSRYGYKEIRTPILMNKNIWEISGHWKFFKDSMFFTEIDGIEYAVKPMNCPGAILVFRNSTKSYRDLPLRLAELGHVHRNELSGVLSGLFRVRALTQDDAHIFVPEKDLEKEIENVVDIVSHFYHIFGFDYHVELSTRPEKYMGDLKAWEIAEKALEEALKKRKMKHKINKGDGAFYGPKIDFHIKDSLGRTWQCATVQVDFQMPERFDIKYTGEDNKEHRPVIIHRVIFGALERFLGILVEHYKGSFPLWLAPVQVRVLSFTERNINACEKLANELQEQGLRVETDLRNNTVEYKVRDAETQKINYIIVIGDKEEKSKTLAVRKRGIKDVAFGVKKDDFIKDVLNEIKEKK